MLQNWNWFAFYMLNWTFPSTGNRKFLYFFGGEVWLKPCRCIVTCMHFYLAMVLGNVWIFPFSIKGWGGWLKKLSIHLSDLIVVNKNSLFNIFNLLCVLPLSKFWGMGEGVYLSHVDSSRSFWGNSSLQSISSINFF